MAGWVSVSPDVAKEHPLYGAKGWLYLVALGCVVMPVRNFLSLYPLYKDLEFAALGDLITSFLYAEIALNIAVGVWALINLALLLRLSSLFPLSFMAMAGFGAVFVTADAVIAKVVFDASGRPMSWEETYDMETIREIARSVVYAAVWIPYMLISRRVNVTYRHRVRDDDALAAKASKSTWPFA